MDLYQENHSSRQRDIKAKDTFHTSFSPDTTKEKAYDHASEENKRNRFEKSKFWNIEGTPPWYRFRKIIEYPQF